MKMYDNILNKAKRYEEKHGIDYAKIDGSLYKKVKIFYIITLAYTLFMNFSYIMGILLTEAKFKVLKGSVYTIAALTIMLITALVMIHFKEHLWVHITALVFNLLSSVGLILIFGKLLRGIITAFKNLYYWRHLIPLCLLIIFGLWLNIIAIRAITRIRRTYKKILEDIYKEHGFSADGESLSDEEWEEILKNI